jgi:hypothetical protein
VSDPGGSDSSGDASGNYQIDWSPAGLKQIEHAVGTGQDVEVTAVATFNFFFATLSRAGSDGGASMIE